MISKRPFSGGFPTQWMVMGISLLIVVLIGFFLFRAQAQARFLDDTDQLAVDLHSTAEADYSTSLRPNSIAAIGLEIIADILRDEEPDSADTAPRLTQLANGLLTPVASVTGQASSGAGSPSPTLGPKNTLGPSPTGPTPTISLSPTITLSPTFSPSSTPTYNVTPGPSSTPTRTSTTTQIPTLGPSSTATATQTRTPTVSPTPTNTPVPPTATNTNLSPTATKTDLPPTPTNTVDVCGDISLSGLSFNGQQVTRTVINGSSSAIIITELTLVWAGSNGELVKIELKGDAIWDAKDNSPPTNIPAESSWKAGVTRTIGAGQSRPLVFQFENTPGGGAGYNTTLIFDNSCQVQQSD